MRIPAWKTAGAIASGTCMAAAFTVAMTAPALAQSAHTTPSVQTLTQMATAPQAQTATPVPCADQDGLSGSAEFWRCTGSSATSKWVGSSCNVNEYNAGDNGTYNVYLAINDCGTRVWLHGLDYPEFTKDGGFADCINPHSSFAPNGGDGVPEFPKNIQVTSNTSDC
jgi:hypothetical protein